MSDTEDETGTEENVTPQDVEAAGTEQSDEAVVEFSHETLRENVRLAVRMVISRRFQDDRVREALTGELLTTIDMVIEDHIAAEKIGRSMQSYMPSNASIERAAPSVEDAMRALRFRVRATLAGRRPGIRQAATAAMRLAPSVADFLGQFVRDETAFAQAQNAATALLNRHVHPVIARQVVSFAAAGAKRAAARQPHEEREPEPQE